MASQLIRNELLAFYENDKLDIKKAHDWAKTHTRSELHKALTWDNEKAGYEYRLYEIRHLVTLHITNDRREPEMVSLTIDRANGGGYRKIDKVLTNQMLTQVMLSDALQELNRVRQRYARIKDLASVWAAIDTATNQRNRQRSG